MSTISISGLSQYYQSVSANPPTQTDDSTDAVNATTDASSAPDSSAAPQQAQQAHHHHHHGGGQFFSKIQAAVTTALQSAQSNGASGPNQIVQTAIESVLKGNGDGSADESGEQSTAPTDASASSTADPQAARDAFFQTLQSYGVDPQQFHQDFLSAIQDAHNGNADPSTAFKSFPPGSNVDTTA